MAAEAGFTGLPMPVFTAFGWAGEDAALKFALSQLEKFIQLLHQNLSREARSEFPYFGLDKEAKNVYLATQTETAEGPYVEFNIRSTALEIRLCVVDRSAIAKGMRSAERDPEDWHRLITKLGSEWSLQLNQSQVDENTQAVTNYQDLFKDSVTELDLETCKTITARAGFLNSEDKWLTPFYLSRRIPAEQAAAMGAKISKVVAAEMDSLLSILSTFIRRQSLKSSQKKSTRKTKKLVQKTRATKQTKGATAKVQADKFTYVTELKPLHLRKGFINLTIGHWPFFTINARTESRQITLNYADDRSDKNCMVWRLQPNDLARIVLSEPVHEWLEDTFDANTKICVEGVKGENDEIQVKLVLAE